jgi:hypothetical protein
MVFCLRSLKHHVVSFYWKEDGSPETVCDLPKVTQCPTVWDRWLFYEFRTLCIGLFLSDLNCDLQVTSTRTTWIWLGSVGKAWNLLFAPFLLHRKQILLLTATWESRKGGRVDSSVSVWVLICKVAKAFLFWAASSAFPGKPIWAKIALLGLCPEDSKGFNIVYFFNLPCS